MQIYPNFIESIETTLDFHRPFKIYNIDLVEILSKLHLFVSYLE